MHSGRTRAAAVALAVLIGGCTYDFDQSGFHGCYLTTNDPQDWAGFELYLMHDEPRQCPVYVAYRFEWMDAAGSVIDRGMRDFARSEMRITNAEHEFVAEHNATFNDNPVTGEWEAQHYVSYQASTAGWSGFPEDYVLYSVGSGRWTDPWAKVEIHYRHMGG